MSRGVMVLERPPEGARILATKEHLNYFDVRGVPLPREMTAYEAWQHMLSRPLFGMKTAFWVRDRISELFGVQKIGGFSSQYRHAPTKGEKLDFFVVEDIDNERLILVQRDRHLDVMTAITTSGGIMAVTSSVLTHNLFGKLYMVPVGIAHRHIVNSLLRRVA